MSRGLADCCHYDDGYDDGYADGKDAQTPERSTFVEALLLLSRERLLAGDPAVADLLEDLAAQVSRDNGFERRIELDRERQANIAKAYTESRQVAA